METIEYRSQQVALMCDISVTNLKRLELSGLLPTARRTATGYRIYSPSEIEHIRDVLMNRKKKSKWDTIKNEKTNLIYNYLFI